MTTQDHTDLLDFYIEREGTLPVKKMTGSFILKQFVIYDMRNFSHCTELILDRGAFRDSDDAFVQAIEEFLTMYQARVTVIAEGLGQEEALFIKLLEAGIGNIVTERAIERKKLRSVLAVRDFENIGSGRNKRYTMRGSAIIFHAVGSRSRWWDHREGLARLR